MSRPIDVVEFLDGVAGATNEIFRLVGSDMQKEAAEASATVAELIDTLKAARAELSDLNSAYGAENIDALIDRCDAALARVGGAS